VIGCGVIFDSAPSFLPPATLFVIGLLVSSIRITFILVIGCELGSELYLEQPVQSSLGTML
jgi:hypothetical protein